MNKKWEVVTMLIVVLTALIFVGTTLEESQVIAPSNKGTIEDFAFVAIVAYAAQHLCHQMTDIFNTIKMKQKLDKLHVISYILAIYAASGPLFYYVHKGHQFNLIIA